MRTAGGIRMYVSFLVIIGDQDNAVALQEASRYHGTLKNNRFNVQYHLLEGVGHTLTDKARELTIEHFRAVMKD